MDRRQAERLVNTYSDLILRLSYTYLKSTADAQDICQTVFLKLLTADAPLAPGRREIPPAVSSAACLIRSSRWIPSRASPSGK